jgi:predicted transcriptional regulator
MYDLEVIRSFLAESSINKVSKKIGISYPTLQKVMIGDDNISLNTLKKILSYIESKQINKGVESKYE